MALNPSAPSFESGKADSPKNEKKGGMGLGGEDGESKIELKRKPTPLTLLPTPTTTLRTQPISSTTGSGRNWFKTDARAPGAGGGEENRRPSASAFLVGQGLKKAMLDGGAGSGGDGLSDGESYTISPTIANYSPSIRSTSPAPITPTSSFLPKDHPFPPYQSSRPLDASHYPTGSYLSHPSSLLSSSSIWTLKDSEVRPTSSHGYIPDRAREVTIMPSVDAGETPKLSAALPNSAMRFENPLMSFESGSSIGGNLSMLHPASITAFRPAGSRLTPEEVLRRGSFDEAAAAGVGLQRSGYEKSGVEGERSCAFCGYHSFKLNGQCVRCRSVAVSNQAYPVPTSSLAPSQLVANATRYALENHDNVPNYGVTQEQLYQYQQNQQQLSGYQFPRDQSPQYGGAMLAPFGIPPSLSSSSSSSSAGGAGVQTKPFGAQTFSPLTILSKLSAHVDAIVLIGQQGVILRKVLVEGDFGMGMAMGMRGLVGKEAINPWRVMNVEIPSQRFGKCGPKPALGSVAGDWQCSCGRENWAKRSVCSRCFPGIEPEYKSVVLNYIQPILHMVESQRDQSEIERDLDRINEEERRLRTEQGQGTHSGPTVGRRFVAEHHRASKPTSSAVPHQRWLANELNQLEKLRCLEMAQGHGQEHPASFDPSMYGRHSAQPFGVPMYDRRMSMESENFYPQDYAVPKKQADDGPKIDYLNTPSPPSKNIHRFQPFSPEQEKVIKSDGFSNLDPFTLKEHLKQSSERPYQQEHGAEEMQMGRPRETGGLRAPLTQAMNGTNLAPRSYSADARFSAPRQSSIESTTIYGDSAYFSGHPVKDGQQHYLMAPGARASRSVSPIGSDRRHHEIPYPTNATNPPLSAETLQGLIKGFENVLGYSAMKESKGSRG